jgi:SAM-dependent methyltransferase
VALFRRIVDNWFDARSEQPLHALLLGVTPEIGGMQWPGPSQVTAADRNLGMILGIWPGPGGQRNGAACADWLELPFRNGQFDTVVGDGCFTLLPYPLGYRGLLDSVHRVLDDGGLFIMRYFVRPETAEATDVVIDDLRAGRIGNFHILKWRLAQSLHGTIEEGVCLADVWNAFDQAINDRAALAARLDWPLEAINTIDAYREVDTRYTFPTLPEIRALSQQHFHEHACHFADYELGDRCPTVVYHAHE